MSAFGFNRWRFGTHPTADAFGWPAKIGLTGVNEQGVFPGLNIDVYSGPTEAPQSPMMLRIILTLTRA